MQIRSMIHCLHLAGGALINSADGMDVAPEKSHCACAVLKCWQVAMHCFAFVVVGQTKEVLVSAPVLRKTKAYRCQYETHICKFLTNSSYL